MPGTNDETRERRGRHILLAVIFPILFLIIMVGIFVRLPPAAVPALGLELVESTTNAVGERFNVLSISNRSGTKVFAYMPQVIVKGETGSVASVAWSAPLPPGASSTLTVPAPASTNGTPWKLSLYVYNDFDLARRVELYVFRRRYHPHFMDSAWIDPAATNGVIAIGRR
jgi:hypothetical protein